jgi:uncharacterized RDD family membrane protein YckC
MQIPSDANSSDESELETIDYSALAYQSNIPRYMAAVIDQVTVIILAVPTIKYLDNDSLPIQLLIGSLVYIAYHFIPEAITGQTLGKMFTGIVVVSADGRKCSIGQAFTRSLFRLFEVNPILGALPAMFSILLSKSRQRIGDRVAGTYVVPKHYVA